MGLDVSAYSGLEKVSEQEASEDEDAYLRLRQDPDFPGRADEIEDNAYYKYTENKHFFSRGYGGYNAWRDELARIAGYTLSFYTEYGKEWPSYAATVWNNPKPGPFMELINFTDCDGIIGAAVSKKLAADFAEFQSKADHEDKRFKEGYDQLRAAFEMASNNGIVKFH